MFAPRGSVYRYLSGLTLILIVGLSVNGGLARPAAAMPVAATQGLLPGGLLSTPAGLLEALLGQPLDLLAPPPPLETPTDTPVALPTDTPVSLPTDTPAFIPTSTPLPTDTPAFFPTSTPLPTDTLTFTPRPTRTPRPTLTPTPTLAPTTFPGGVDPQVLIPAGRTPILDGICDRFEYRDALALPFVDGNNTTGTVYLKHDAQRLYVCMVGAVGSDSQRFVGVYLDPDHGREAFPHADEISLRADLTDAATYALQGGGTPGMYVPVNLAGWQAKSSVLLQDQAEYSISLGLVGCSGAFGLAVYHHWFDAPANDYGWPASQYYDQPQTWALAGLDTGIASRCLYLPLINH